MKALSTSLKKGWKMKKRSRYILISLVIVLVAALAGCSGVSQEQYDDLQSQLSQAQQERDTAESQASSLQKEVDDAEDQLASLQVEYDATKARLDTAQGEIADLQEESAGKSETIAQVQEELSGLEAHLDFILDTQMMQYYRLNFQLRNYEWDLPVTLRSYFAFKEKARPGDLVAMILEYDAALDTLVSYIKDSTLINNLKKSEVVNVVNKLVQGFPRTNKDVKTPYDDYPRYPVETLVEQAGDSQDTSILVAALLYRLEYDVVLFNYEELEHMAVGVYMPGTGGQSWEHKGKKYYYLETTGDTWLLGNCPPYYIIPPDIYEVVE
jgi:hypothetical protein